MLEQENRNPKEKARKAVIETAQHEYAVKAL